VKFLLKNFIYIWQREIIEHFYFISFLNSLLWIKYHVSYWQQPNKIMNFIWILAAF